MSAIKSLTLCLVFLVLVTAAPFASANAKYFDILGLTILSDNSNYYNGQLINIFGNFTQYGQLVLNGLVGISIYDPSGAPIVFRTLRTGPDSPPSFPVNFLELTPCNSTGVAQYSFPPQQSLWVRVAVKNYDDLEHYAIATITVLDANSVPLVTLSKPLGALSPSASVADFFPLFMGTNIPSWAQPGNATLIGSIFSAYPKDGGIAYCEEKRVNFEIQRNPQLHYSTPPAATQTPNGTFATSFRLSPGSRPGSYQADASAQSTLMNGTQQSLLTVQSAISFSLINTPTPPQAAFTQYPLNAYINTPITFDASASVAEGYNVIIANYEWDFGDGSQKVDTSNAVIGHTFTLLNVYTVTLNVTDSQGLWCTTSKAIMAADPNGPQAAFTYSPVDSCVNMIITFDASTSTSINTINSYQWDFGDGSQKVVTANPLVNHTFTVVGIYTVALNVTDSQGLWCTMSTVITILSSTLLKANFAWHPSIPKPNDTATFDASTTELGWNGTAYVPIINYVWDFGDGNITSGYYPTTVHTYVAVGSYEVMLNVTDASGFTSSATYVVGVRETALIGDINGDGTVDISDAILLSNAYGSGPGDPNWNPLADLNGDGTVDILDAIILSAYYGESI